MLDSTAIAIDDAPFAAPPAPGGVPARVYTSYFTFADAPFSITPDPDYLFLSETHRNAIEKIHYGIRSRLGFMLLTGEVGTGKTTLCRALLDQLQDQAQTVYIINPSLSGPELFSGILDDLGLDHAPAASKKVLIDTLNRFLLRHQATRPLVIIIDDAQTMPLETLEDLRLLSNLETDKHKLLQLLLVGQPELLTHIARPELRQLRQRVAVHCGLDLLNAEEVRGYVDRRLFIAGNQGQVRFTPRALKRIHRQSRGVPRMINKICDLALTAAFVANDHLVDVRHVKAAGAELIERQTPPARTPAPRRRLWPLGYVLVAVAALGLGFALHPLVRARPDFPVTQVPAATPASGPADGAPRAATPPAAVTAADHWSPALPPTADPGAYILQLGSYTTLATTLRAIDIYAQQGLAAHWNALPCGENRQCFRVFAGRFTSRQAARRFQDAQSLPGALVRYAPWAVAIGTPSSAAAAALELQRLKRAELDAYPVYDGAHRLRLAIGAFGSRAEADAMALQIGAPSGNPTEVIELTRPWPAAEAREAVAGGAPTS